MVATTKMTMLRLWNTMFNDSYNTTLMGVLADSSGVSIYVFGEATQIRIPHDEWQDIVRFVKEEMGEEITDEE